MAGSRAEEQKRLGHFLRNCRFAARPAVSISRGDLEEWVKDRLHDITAPTVAKDFSYWRQVLTWAINTKSVHERFGFNASSVNPAAAVKRPRCGGKRTGLARR